MNHSCPLDNTHLVPFSQKLLRCPQCSLLVNRDFTYRPESYTHYLSSARVSAKERYVNELRLNSLLKKVVHGKILDIGCSKGVFLELAKNEGFEAFGVEPDLLSRKVCKEKGITILEEPDLKRYRESFDAVCIFHTLEHVEDPLGMLKQAYLSLKPGGYLFLETPNTDSLGFKIQKDRWLHVHPLHLLQFSKNTLSLCVRKAGFKSIRVTPVGGSSWLSGLLKNKPRGDDEIKGSAGFFYRQYLKFARLFCLSEAQFLSARKPLAKIPIAINARYLQRAYTGIENMLYYTLKELEHHPKLVPYLFYFGSKNIDKTLNLPYEVYPPWFNTRVTRLVWEACILPLRVRGRGIRVLHGPSYAVPLIKTAKYVSTMHDLSFKFFPKSYTQKTRWYYRLLLPLATRMSDHIITISQASARDLVQFFPQVRKKLIITPLAVARSFKPVPSRKVREKYTLHKPYLLVVGSLIPRKNIVRILRAFAQFQKECSSYDLVLVGGSAWGSCPVLAAIKELGLTGSVRVLGNVPGKDLPALYSGAKVFLFPSLHEGFGLPLLEAMACGAPVLTSNVSSMPEVAGGAALLVNPFSIKEIEEGIKKLLDPKVASYYRKKGFTRIKQFSWKKTAEETAKVYGSLLKR